MESIIDTTTEFIYEVIRSIYKEFYDLHKWATDAPY